MALFVALACLFNGLPPEELQILDKEIPKEYAIYAMQKSGHEVPDNLRSLGTSGWDAFKTLDTETGQYQTRLLYQGALRNGDKIAAQLAKIHTHKETEISYVAFGAAHVWTWMNGVETYRFYKMGDMMGIPAGVPHCVVAASHVGEDGIEQLGILYVRPAEPANPQIPSEEHAMPDVIENAPRI